MTHQDEYNENLVTMLELIWGKGYMAPGGPGNVAKLLDVLHELVPATKGLITVLGLPLAVDGLLYNTVALVAEPVECEHPAKAVASVDRLFIG